PTRPTLASGFSTASSVTRSVSATGRPFTSCFSSAYSSCVTLPRRHSRSHFVVASCAAFAAAPHAQQTSSSPTIVLFFTSFPQRPSLTLVQAVFGEELRQQVRHGNVVHIGEGEMRIALEAGIGQAQHLGLAPVLVDLLGEELRHLEAVRIAGRLVD